MIANNHGFEVHKCNESKLQLPSEAPSEEKLCYSVETLKFFLIVEKQTMPFWVNFQV